MSPLASDPFDALIVVSFGGPESPDDVLPFLENVLRGKNVPRERMLEVAEHYNHFGGVSPINEQNRALIRALIAELNEHGPQLPVYWGNRNWHPLLTDAVQQMADDGVRRALAFVTSAFGSYSGCRQYREDIARARQEVGAFAPEIAKIRAFYNHPGFIEVVVERVRRAWDQIPAERRSETHLLMTAHSIPQAMAATGPYQQQLEEACRLVAEALPVRRWRLAYQSRSGPPSQPWLEPDVGDVLREIAAADGSRDVLVVPLGFLSDHIEVLFDLDTEAAALAQELGLQMVRAETVGTHPRFVRMIRELVQERVQPDAPRLALGSQGPWPDVCPEGCCQFTADRPGTARA